jgi:hypothetical protein
MVLWLDPDAGDQRVKHGNGGGITLRRLRIQLGSKVGYIGGKVVAKFFLALPIGKRISIRRQDRVGNRQNRRNPILPVAGQTLESVDQLMVVNRVIILAVLCEKAIPFPLPKEMTIY